MYSRPLTSKIFEPWPRFTTKAASSAQREVPSTPPGRRWRARSRSLVSSADRVLVESAMVDLVSVRGRCKRREAHYPPRPVTLSRRATVYRHERGALRHRLPSGVPRPLWRAVRGGGGARLRVDRGGRLPVGVPRTLRSPHRGRPPHAAEPPRPPRHQSAHAAPRGDGQRDLERGRAGRWPRSARARLGRQRDLHHRGAPPPPPRP